VLIAIVVLLLSEASLHPTTLAAPLREPSPLELLEPDPLLPEDFKPKRYKKRPLSAAQQSTLAAALDRLNNEAAAQLAAGNDRAAFAIWNRELRLRRFLGPLLEVKALGRVGDIAWAEGNGKEVRIITQRLKEIEQEETKAEQLNLPLKQALAIAYEQVREREPALRFYQELLDLAREQGDEKRVLELLQTIGNLHLTWFYYLDAAEIYRELLAIAEQKGDRFTLISHLKQLIYIYDQGKFHQDAIDAKQRLEQFYLVGEGISDDPLKAAIPDPEAGQSLIPALKLSIGDNYEALAQLENAFRTYQESYSLAWGLQHFAEASIALRRIISLYLAQDQINEALQTYEVLLLSDQQGYNMYGQMTSYDEIAQIYREHQDYNQALRILRQGLELARTLKYRETYFEAQIEQVTQFLGSGFGADPSFDPELPFDPDASFDPDLLPEEESPTRIAEPDDSGEIEFAAPENDSP